ncbi:MAG: outer membrane lipoprotein-sorting protein, partial [Deltaproteobacteria bacterium]|nr:outer membrane lipoprotein-sorting protein [Deltaproteobacteria bacterium]
DKVKELEGVWIPMELTMRNLQLDTFTTLTIDDMEPNPKLHRKTFDLSRLESH